MLLRNLQVLAVLAVLLRTASAQGQTAVDVFRAALALETQGCTVPLPHRDVENGRVTTAAGNVVCTQRNNVPGGTLYNMCGQKRIQAGAESNCAHICATDTQLTGHVGGCTGFGYAAGNCHLYTDSTNCGNNAALNWWTCHSVGSGHRRAQLGLPIWSHTATCDPARLQNRAAEVDQACCRNDACSASGGVPDHCSYRCAVHFVPFWADCGPLLSSVGQDLSTINDMCTPDALHLSTAQNAVDNAVCTNAILSCRRGANYCVDATTPDLTTGQVVTPAELAQCSQWAHSGGGWTPSTEPCAGVSGNLIVNGDFESPSLTAVDCHGQYDSVTTIGGSHCQYKYVYPTLSQYCTSSCALDGWTTGRRDVTNGMTNIALLENGNRPWGGLNSHSGTQFISLQGSGVYVEQQLNNLVRGAVYELRLRVANRPGYTDTESLIMKLDNRVIAESAHPPDNFDTFAVAFTASSTSAVLRLENNSPGNGDTSVFVDEVTVTPVQIADNVPVPNANFDDDTLRAGDTYVYHTPSGWTGGGGVVTVLNGSAPWGGLTCSGTNYVSLQGLGSYIEVTLTVNPGSTYIVEFQMTDRPGFGEDELCHVKVDGQVIWESTHPDDGFSEYSAIFTATDYTATLRFENDSPEGDRSIFIDDVRVNLAAHALSVVLPASSADSQPYDFDLLTTPMTWADAEAECVRRNRHLASLHSDAENAFAAAMHHGADASIYQGVFIGMRDPPTGMTVDGSWSWVDGTDTDYTNWGPDEPNNGHHAVCTNTVTTPQCGENCVVMAAHLSQWTDHSNAGGGNNRTAGREDYQWNDGGCGGRQQALCGPASRNGSRSLLAYYSFDSGSAEDQSGNHRDGVIEGAVTFVNTGVTGRAARFDGASRIRVSSFRNWAWGSHFAVSVWFLRDPTHLSDYEGIVNNGYYRSGSWEIRMGREMNGTMLGGGVITEGHDETWDVTGVPAATNQWHHACLVYDSDTVSFYLDGERTTDESDHGNILSRSTDVFIGQAGTGTSREYFTGLIDEVKIYSRALSHVEVLDLYRSTPHNGGHCENGADFSHCAADGADYCDATSVRQITDVGAAMGTLGSPIHESPRIDAAGVSCSLDNVLAPDGMPAGLARPAIQRTYAVLDGQAVTACMEIAWDQELEASGIRFAAASSDEPMCGAADSCRGQYCATGGTFKVFTSGAQRSSLTDYTTFHYQGMATVPVDTSGSGNGVSGQMLFDELTFRQGDQAVQFLAVCRTGAGGARDNILFDWVALRASQRDYQATTAIGGHCNPRPAPPPPPLGTTFAPGSVFSINSYDGQSWQRSSSIWSNVGSSGVGSAHLAAAHFVPLPLPSHFEFNGANHFTFDHPEAFDFAGDFSIQILVKPPPHLSSFHFLVSRRASTDKLSHHHVFIDTRSSWVGNWQRGQPVAVMYMGAGPSNPAVWAHTETLTVGDYVQLAFTVRGGQICGFVNGQRSGDCSARSIPDYQRQLGTGEPLEVGGENSYHSHPLWSLASVMYWDRHLSQAEVLANYAASQCLELETQCP